MPQTVQQVVWRPHQRERRAAAHGAREVCSQGLERGGELWEVQRDLVAGEVPARQDEGRRGHSKAGLGQRVEAKQAETGATAAMLCQRHSPSCDSSQAGTTLQSQWTRWRQVRAAQWHRGEQAADLLPALMSRDVNSAIAPVLQKQHYDHCTVTTVLVKENTFRDVNPSVRALPDAQSPIHPCLPARARASRVRRFRGCATRARRKRSARSAVAHKKLSSSRVLMVDGSFPVSWLPFRSLPTHTQQDRPEGGVPKGEVPGLPDRTSPRQYCHSSSGRASLSAACP